MPLVDPDEYRAYMKRYMRERHERIRKQVVADLGGRCTACGTSNDLEIDHIDPLKKTMEPERMMKVCEARRREEMKNCQLLCRKHHEEKTLVDQVTVREVTRAS